MARAPAATLALMSQMSGAKYELGRRGERCAATGDELKPGEAIVVALVEREGDEGLDRLDFKAAAWDEGHRPERLFAHWRTTVRERGATGPVLDMMSMATLFEELASQGESLEPRQSAFRYVLALALIRKRQLELVGSGAASDGRPGALMVRVRSEGPESPVISVPDSSLDSATLAEVSERLGMLMKGDE